MSLPCTEKKTAYNFSLMKKLLKKLFPSYYKPQWIITPKHEVELAFTHDGVEYYRFVNDQNIPSERAFCAIDIYEELNQRLTREYLEEMFKATLIAINKGDLVKAGGYITFAQQRVGHISNIEILYKLASVIFFTKEENFNKYDREYNEKKIDTWKASGDIEGFFLKTPIGEFLPSLTGSNMSIQDYTIQQNKDMLQNLQYLSSILSEEEKEKGILSGLGKQEERLKKWNASLK